MVILWFVIAVGFGIWSAIGKEWYWYALAPVLVVAASSFLCTSYIQGVTRLYAIVLVSGVKRIRSAIVIFVINGTSLLLGGAIAYFAIGNWVCLSFFIVLCVIFSTIVAVGDGQFELAVKREQSLQELLKISRIDGV